MAHTRTRLMAAVAVLAMSGALAAGCGDKETPAANNAADSAPGAAGAGGGAPDSASPTPTAHKSHKHHAHKKKAHKKPHRTRAHRHHASAHREHRRPAHHHPAHPRHTAKPTPKPAAPSAGTATERKVVKLVNAARAKAGCHALRVDRRLRKAAYLHSRDMGVHDYFDHSSRDGRTPWDRIKAQGYRWPSAENIAAGQRSPASVMDAWMHSAGHRANILNCDYKAIGVGVWKGSGGPVWTQDFGFK